MELGGAARPGGRERPRVLLGHPLPDVRVGRRERALARDPQPVLRRAARGRGAARHRGRRSRTGPRRATPPARPGRCSTTSCSTAGSSAAARCGSGGATCSSGASRSRATRSRRCTRSSGRCSTRSSTARRRTAASRSASTAGRPCSRTRRTSARSWPSRRRSPGTRPHARGAVGARAGAARRARPAVRRHEARRRRRSDEPRRRAASAAAPRLSERPRAGFLEPIARRPRLAALARRDVHRVLGHLLPLRRGHARRRPRSFRCLYGLPILALVGWYEHRRYGPLPSRAVWLAIVAGVFFAGDLLSWHHAVDAVGAGLATVLGNLQVLVVGARRVAGLRRAAAAARAPRPADRPRRRRPDLGRHRRPARTASNPPLGVALGIFTALVVRRLPAHHPARLERPAPARRARSRSRPPRPRSSRSSSASCSASSTRCRPGRATAGSSLVGHHVAVDRLPRRSRSRCRGCPAALDLDHPAGPARRDGALARVLLDEKPSVDAAARRRARRRRHRGRDGPGRPAPGSG